MSIYQPYFYIIQEVSTGIYYAGAKWAKDANPATFMIEHGYLTSSNTIKNIINEHGINSFRILRIRKFEEGIEAYDYETRFLQKIDARNNSAFYNKHNNDTGAKYQVLEGDNHMFYGKRNNEIPWFGMKRSEKSKEKYSKSKIGSKNPSSCEYWIYNDKDELVSYFKSNFIKNAMEIINHRPTVNALMKTYRYNTKLEYKKKGITGPYPIYDRKYDGWYAIRKAPVSRIKSENDSKGRKHFYNLITCEEVVSYEQPPGFIEGRLPHVGEKISATKNHQV